MTRPADGPSTRPSRQELLDALYLAAYQDAAVPYPYRDWQPGRTSDRSRREPGEEAAPDDGHAGGGPAGPDSGREPGAPPAPAPEGGSSASPRAPDGDSPAPSRAPDETGTRPSGAPEHGAPRDEARAGAANGHPPTLRAARGTLHAVTPGRAAPDALGTAHPFPSRPGRAGEDDGAAKGGRRAVGGLPASRELARSLRPLRLRRPSPSDWTLDEEATAERAAAEGLWLPVCHPAEERRIRLALIVDDHSSMTLWQESVRQLRRVMEEVTAFRFITVTRVDITAAGSRIRALGITEGVGGQGPDSIALVVTDGHSDSWRNGDAAAYVHALARTGPTAVLSLMPQEAWEITLPTAVRAELRVPGGLVPNRRTTVRRLSPALQSLGDPHSPYPAEPVPVPLLELTPGSFARWARLVASWGARHEMAVLLTGPDGDLELRTDQPVGLPGPLPGRPRETVQRFMARVSPTTFALARRLAAAPLNLPVMRLVQRMPPSAATWNLAEIMMFGLLRRIRQDDDVEDAEHVSFDFADGIREELLGLGTRPETMSVLRQISADLGPRLARAVVGGEALVAWQADAPDPPLDDRTRPFVRHLRTALCALSGPYQARANRLQLLLHEERGRKRTSDPPANMTQGDQSDTVESHPVRPVPVTPPQESPSSAVSGGAVSSTVEQPAASATTPAQHPVPNPRRIGASLPLRNRNFTGREALLEKLRRRMADDVTTAVLPEALHGMGGVGKSQIAIEYVYRYGREYELIWWIPAEQTNLIVQSLIELGEHMGLRAGADRSAVPAVLEALRVGQPYSNWLLVFDNAENPHEVRQFFPHNGPGRVMVTSRNSQWSTLASSLEVDVFTRTESVALIKRRSPQIPEEAADRLADALGDLPLAVEQAAVWLAETGMPANQYLDLFETKCAQLLELTPPADYDLPVAAAWNVSLDRLREDHPAALQLLQICAFFAPEPISRGFFQAVRGIDGPAELRAALEDPIKISQAVREIGRYALARIDHRNATIQVHRLVQRVLIEQMNPQERAKMRHCAHQILANADPRNPGLPETWQRYSALLPHVRATRMVECEDGWARQLILNEAQFMLERSDYEEALEVSAEAAAMWRRALGDDHEHVIAVDQVRALALRWQNRYSDAHDLQQELVERCRRVLGERNETTQRALSVLAILLRLNGDFYQARELDQRAYETTALEFGPDDPGTLQAAHNYTVSLRLAGDFAEALRLDEETYGRRVEVLGDDHMSTLSSRYQMALDLQELGRGDEAREMLADLRSLALQRLGPEHDMTIRATRELSVTLRKLGRHDDALELSSAALKVLREKAGERSLETVRAALNHATDLRQTGDLERAAELGRATRDRCRDLLGEVHPHTYATATNLAVTLRLLGRIDEAHDLDHAAVDGLSRVLSPHHPRSLLARTNLASDHYAVGRFAEASDMDRELLDLSRQSRGQAHPSTLAVMLNLSYDLQSLGESARAQELYERAVVLFHEVHGPDHQATADAENHKRANCDIDLLGV
ncbi:FxSxx-COOH system tetratricopeptide repeat protein [Streptomyces sp. NPDC048392]|uniref:FxSxx-COOH system tetratricopeptide repeat protein n=1 Tax=Streptomyces sp. NPDC048392 TaxID=3365543 RepID=UPI0037183264